MVWAMARAVPPVTHPPHVKPTIMVATTAAIADQKRRVFEALDSLSRCPRLSFREVGSIVHFLLNKPFRPSYRNGPIPILSDTLTNLSAGRSDRSTDSPLLVVSVRHRRGPGPPFRRIPAPGH